MPPEGPHLNASAAAAGAWHRLSLNLPVRAWPEIPTFHPEVEADETPEPLFDGYGGEEVSVHVWSFRCLGAQGGKPFGCIRRPDFGAARQRTV